MKAVLTDTSFNAVWNYSLTTRIYPPPYQTPHSSSLVTSSITLQSQHTFLRICKLYVSLVKISSVLVND